MQENSRYAVGIDVGTTMVRCLVAHIDSSNGSLTIVGSGSAPNTGMRKGTVVNLTGPAQAIDDALGEAERMSGYQVNEATISINGTHIVCSNADGMIAVGSADHTISFDDIHRIEEVATTGKVPANREILDVVPHAYKLDGQDNIKDPIGMTGTRLEVNAHVVSALIPHLTNLQKSTETAKVVPRNIVVAGIAAARAVLTEQQLENGVALIDIGGATTNIAIYEEGDLQYAAVLPYGGINITNDLAIGLKTDPEIAEKVKIEHASAVHRSQNSGISLKHDDEIISFQTNDIDEIVEARLEEIFEAIQYEFKRAGRAGKLPGGVVLTGGTANLKDISEYAKHALGLAARVGKTSGYAGVVDNIKQPEFATVVGLMLIDSDSNDSRKSSKNKMSDSFQKTGGLVSKFINRFRA